LSLTKDSPKTVSRPLKRREEKRSNTYTSEFELFWKAYSKSSGKSNAFKEWNKLKPDVELIKLITEKAKLQTIAIPESQYRKDAERWIRDRRWEDELTATTSERVNFI
jgi:hypothetical protein